MGFHPRCNFYTCSHETLRNNLVVKFNFSDAFTYWNIGILKVFNMTYMVNRRGLWDRHIKLITGWDQAQFLKSFKPQIPIHTPIPIICIKVHQDISIFKQVMAGKDRRMDRQSLRIQLVMSSWSYIIYIEFYISLD